MKTRHFPNQPDLITQTFALTTSMLLLGNDVQAADGRWTQISGGGASGTWTDGTTNTWANGVIADGSGSTADFSALDVAGGTNSTITLSGARTIGSLIFGDTNTASPNVWVLSGSSTLTLAGTSPTITNKAPGETSRAAVNVILAGSDGLTKAGAGTLSLGGANIYTGGTTISEGRLRARNSTAFGATSGAVTVANGAGLELDNSVTVANTINLNGNSALTLVTGNNTLSGTVSLQSAAQINMTGTSGTLLLSGALNLDTNQLTVVGPRLLTLSGPISGTANLSLESMNATTIVSGDSRTTFSGQVHVIRSTVAVGHDGALGSGSIVLGVNDQLSAIRSTNTTTRSLGNGLALTGTTGSTYRFGSTQATENGNLTFTNTTDIALAHVKKFEVHNRTEFNAGFTGNGGGITMQTGTGTLILNGDNTYTGATTVNAGTLLVNGSLASAVTVNTGGSLGGGGTVGGAATIASGGKYSAGAVGTIGNQIFSQNLTLDVGSIFAWDLATASTSSGFDTVTGSAGGTFAAAGEFRVVTDLDFSNNPFWYFQKQWSGIFNSFGTTTGWSSLTAASVYSTAGNLRSDVSTYGSFTINGSTLTWSAVPEPSSTLAGLLLGVGLLRRRRA